MCSLPFGFRSGYSTGTALTNMSDKIWLSLDNALYTGMVIVNLQTAFDTVNHDILLHKLKLIGIDDNCVNLF